MDTTANTIVKPKININELLSVNINVENFRKYMDYIEEVNKKLMFDINDLKRKFNQSQGIPNINNDNSDINNNTDHEDVKMKENLFKFDSYD
jgi:hypothetical protein